MGYDLDLGVLGQTNGSIWDWTLITTGDSIRSNPGLQVLSVFMGLLAGSVPIAPCKWSSLRVSSGFLPPLSLDHLYFGSAGVLEGLKKARFRLPLDPGRCNSSSISPELIRRIGFSLGGRFGLDGRVRSSLEGIKSGPKAISVRLLISLSELAV